MDSIEKLLAELKDEYNCPSPEEVVEGTGTHPKFQSKAKAAKQSINQASSTSSSFDKGDAIDRLLSDVKADFEQQHLEQELQKQQNLEQQRLKEKRLQAKQQELLQLRAREWLDKLDAFSYEGLWFEKFAQGHSSKLAAAIEYLQANQENT